MMVIILKGRYSEGGDVFNYSLHTGGFFGSTALCYLGSYLLCKIVLLLYEIVRLINS